MNYLIDTHVFLWGAVDETRISKKAFSVMENADNDLYISSASIWEIIIKARAGKLELPFKINQFIADQMSALKLKPLPIQISHAENLYKLPDHHKDPFDRMLVSQAQVENIDIITSDLLIAKYDIKVVW